MKGKMLHFTKSYDTLYFDREELQQYKDFMVRHQRNVELLGEELRDVLEARLAERGVNAIFTHSYHRKHKFRKRGLAVLDIETYMDSSTERNTVYNMVPFCATLYGRLQQMYTHTWTHVLPDGTR